MIIVTSVPPNSQNSIDAVKTWGKHGKVYSLNSEKELPIEGYKGVSFISTHRVMQWNNRELVSINAMIDFAIQLNEDLLLINSDIIIERLPEFNDDGITILTRCDYETGYEQGRLYEHGWDAFFIPKHFLKMFPQTIFCMGNTFWDYGLPFNYLSKGILVYWPQGKCIFHKTHVFAWDFDEWQNMAKFFKWLFKIDDYISLEQMATNILSDIQRRTIK